MGVARLLLSRFKNYSLVPRFVSTAAALIERPWTYDISEVDESDGKSAVYRRALKFQRPTTIRFQENFLNSVSLIGSIVAPFEKYHVASGRFGVSTSLKVDSSPRAYCNLRVVLKFWDEMAEMAVEHLKPSDLIYVLGSLVSNKQMDEDGKSIYWYQVNVTEVNFIIQHAQVPAWPSSLKLKPKVSAEEILRMRTTRLHLWQVFFSSPDEWWDNRNSKRNPNSPDFKHKDTGEALWLKDTDPEWVKKLLLLRDSRLHKRGSRKQVNTLSHLSPLVYDDAKGS